MDLFIYFCLCVYGGKLGFEQFGFLLARLVPFLFHDVLLGRSAGYKYRNCKHCDGEEEYRLDAVRCSTPPQRGVRLSPSKAIGTTLSNKNKMFMSQLYVSEASALLI